MPAIKSIQMMLNDKPKSIVCAMIIAGSLALSGCANQPTVQAVQTPCPTVPEPPQALMKPIQPSFQERVRDFLRSWQPTPTESESKPQPGANGR